MSAQDRIIVPLDVPTKAEAIALLDRLPQVSFWKVGLELFVGAGPSILQTLKERNKRIFLDLKFHDIPNTVAGACRSAARYGVDLLTIHAAAGKPALESAQAALKKEAIALNQPVPNLIAITLLTSLNSRSLAFDLKVPVELPEYVLHMALLAKESGLAGIVCSPQEAAQIRDICGDQFLRICPGVRPTWAATGDQRRSLTPKQALEAGANYLVIGRPITAADEPAQAFERICAECD
ncbi:MAG: orotidine-5'-phosphate decarboxylase [Elainellaceae cyanobacterium]